MGTYLNVPARLPPPAFLFPILTMSKTEVRITTEAQKVRSPNGGKTAQCDKLVSVEESGAYTALNFRVKQFFKKDFLATLASKTTRLNRSASSAERRL